ncbi:glycoside hydrolase family 16 protein [Cryobacterium zhongshanensis]|uniref:Glycoside hydrolase family 16 protein n=1 Tax=Cryobacterium zhongshanensis TaxID=2928153 RepID=A0AA41QVM8_9MICO|nr:glycoside hydrolase family 16 protein [Cryobacterium zhongshanensis]MCI4658140.1 glycoside hydrolase family 16 protein [Cryobacterium zhongshanensis]
MPDAGRTHGSGAPVHSAPAASPVRRRIVVAAAAGTALALLAGVFGVVVASSGTAALAHPEPLTVWSDEFDGPAGSLPNPANWTFQLGAGGWGNHELQTYTDTNARLDGDSHLLITAAIGTDADGRPTYTSSRLTTAGKVTVQYGTLEARIRLPDGRGLLPAFWLLGDTVDTVGWPAAGEIDVVETPGSTARSAHHLHAAATTDRSADRSLSADVAHSPALSGDFHLYSVEREPGRVTIRVDGRAVLSATPDTAPADLAWAFDGPFQVLLDVAIGGDWPGAPDATTPAISQLIVDWVRLTPDPGGANLSVRPDTP